MCGRRSTVPVRPDGRDGHPARRVVVATHVRRLRQDQADRAPRARIVRNTRGATAGLTVTRLANHDGQLTFAGTAYRAGRMCPHLHRRHHRHRSVQLSKDGEIIRVHPIRHDRSRELGAFANPQGRARRKHSAICYASQLPEPECRPGTGTHLAG